MAVTVQTQPAIYTPAYNPQWFVATSTQTAQPNFRYRVVLTDLISSGTVTKDVDADPNGYFRFDVGSFSEQYITQVNPSGLYGWQENTGAVRNIRVNIGEVYGATPTYYAGANTDFIVWNGALDFLTMQSYNYLNYLYTQGNNIQIITNNHNPSYVWTASSTTPYYSNDETVTASKSSYLYFLTSAAGDLEKIRIIGYDSDGNQMGSSVIRNTASGSTTYTEKYQFIDLGYDGLLNMPTGQILSGDSPIPVATYQYWDVYDESSWLPVVGGGGDPFIFPLKRYNLVCEPRFDVITTHYLSPEGSFETQPCTKLSLRTTEVTKSSYSKLPYTLTGYVVGYTYGASVDNTLTSTLRDKITVNTDWLTVLEVEQLKDAISSPVVYVDLGDAGGYIAMKITNNSFQIKKKYNEQMLSVSFDLEYTHINVRQRG